MRLRTRWWFASLLFVAGCQPSSSSPEAPNFDYWVLALSWSPEYCASDAAKPGSRQCAQPREFIVHGLWPQYERGYPEFCDTQTRVPERIADQLGELVPDRGLVYYQWKKHGSCSGMTPDDYFARLERAGRSVVVPGALLRQAATRPVERIALESAFIAANPAVTPAAITFHCRGAFLREVRICLDHGLQPRTCGADLREGCGRDISVRSDG
ncbi:ribonuclease T2 family protein [Panacagrimonas sp.]|uniref:ribonuclease T2 family protein n=1 Tax=Panacagrimonas sp. TaxID=2480088 RepID=UPI003B52355D